MLAIPTVCPPPPPAPVPQWPKGFVNLLGYFQVLINVNLLDLPAVNLFDWRLNLAIDCDRAFFGEVQFYDTFEFAVLAPAILTLFFLGCGAWGYFTIHRFHDGGRFRKKPIDGKPSDEAAAAKADKAVQKHLTKCWQLFFFMLLVVYPSVSRVSLQMLDCVRIDDRVYLSADYTIDCETHKYRVYYGFAWVSVVVYIVGIPLGMFWTLRFLRNNNIWMSRVFILYASYEDK